LKNFSFKKITDIFFQNLQLFESTANELVEILNKTEYSGLLIIQSKWTTHSLAVKSFLIAEISCIHLGLKKTAFG
jgi:hypothetical protein